MKHFYMLMMHDVWEDKFRPLNGRGGLATRNHYPITFSCLAVDPSSSLIPFRHNEGFLRLDR